MTDRLLPNPVGLNAEFYAWCARGELRLQRCSGCGTWRHPPRFRCAVCVSDEFTWERVSGRGKVFTWTVTHRAVDPAFEPPYAVVIVELAEGPRVVGNLRGIPLDGLALDLPVSVEVEPVSDAIGVLWFSPA
ncbi:MAG TPA: OB-fold domain-containing protein [Acidimicrobiia bacterium]|nr:OB-fold domain-containing protein [Acidimicrobiia bacterium]